MKIKRYIPEFVYGGMDGIITTFAVVSGATGAEFSLSVIWILGFANLFADGLSMSIGNYLSVKTEQQSTGSIGDKAPISTAIATFISFIVMGNIPLIVYSFAIVFKNLHINFLVWSSVSTLIGFLIIAYLKSYVVKVSLSRSIFETLGLGFIAALVAYLVGVFGKQLVGG